jgi:ABC-2 type transport system permease protein/sodium transport system permease protein
VFEFEMAFRDGDPRSESAMLEFRKAMQLINDFQSAALRGPTIPAAVQLLATAMGQRVDASASLAGILPLVLILMTITGAVYPAIDLTAGERERGTMEAMIATPAPRFVLLLSKYVAVVTVAVLTALANLFASWITLSIGGLGKALLGERGFSLLTLIQILPLLVIFAAFFSAILLAMCSFARSFKEAQAYLIPVMLVSLAPALVTLMPNIEFSTLLGIVPLINILLLSREIMSGSPAALPAFAAVLSTLLYAAAALVVASRLFGAESATAGSQESWSDLLRRPRRVRAKPDLGELAIYLAILFPIFFIATNLVGQQELGITSKLWGNALLLVLLFLIAPACFAWYRRLAFPTTFLLASRDARGGGGMAGRMGRWIAYAVSAILLAGGLWIMAYEGLKLLSDWGFGTLSIERTEALDALTRSFLEVPFWVVLATSAVVPAFAEEFFFRGFVLSAFRSRVSKTRAVVYSALLFALFHVINGSVLSIERFAPTLLLGLALGTLAVRTGLLWPGILLHSIHNGLLFWLTRFSKQELAGWFGSGNEHFPALWLGASVASILIGLVVLFVFTADRNDEVPA